MKKRLLFAALFSAALVSCTKDQVVEVQQDEIKFRVATENATKVTTSGENEGIFCANNYMDNFKIYASHINGNAYSSYITGKTVSKTTSGNWMISGDSYHYWPNEGSLDFFAVVNATINNWQNYGASTSPILEFTVQPSPSSQKDLVYAVNKGLTKATNSGSAVLLNFRHALSQIEFRAKNLNPNIHVVVTGVQVCNVQGGTATYTLPAYSTTSQIIDHNNNGKQDNEVSGEDTQADVTYNPDGSTSEQENQSTRGVWTLGENNYTTYEATFDDVTLSTEEKSLTYSDVSGTPKVEYNSNTMLLFPQSRDPWNPVSVNKPEYDDDNNSSNKGVYFMIKCKIYNIAGDSYVAGDVQLWGENDEAEYAAIPVQIDWEEGKKYIYTFIFDKDGNGGYNPKPTDPNNPEPVLVPIKLDVKVDDFTKGDVSDVDMDTTTSPVTGAPAQNS